MIGDFLLGFLVLVLLILPVPALIATRYLWKWWRRERDNWVLRDFFIIALVANIVALPIAFLAGRRIIGLAPLEGGAFLTAACVVVLEGLPIFLAFEFWRRSRDPMQNQRRDDADAAREQRQAENDEAREEKQTRRDNEREQGRNVKDAKRERDRNVSDDVREEQHAERNKVEGNDHAKQE